MKNRFQNRMDRAFNECPGVTLAEMPGNERATGSIVVEGVCAKVAFDFLRRRFHIEEKEFIEETGELKFVIVPRTRQQRGQPARVRYQKPVQFELPLA